MYNLMPFQKAVYDIIEKESEILNLDMGLGKTVICAHYVHEKRPKRTLIVCPLEVIPTWIEHLKNIETKIIVSGKVKKEKAFEMITGEDRIFIVGYDYLTKIIENKIKIIYNCIGGMEADELISSGNRLVRTNYIDGIKKVKKGKFFRNKYKKQAREEIQKTFKPFDLIIYDEVHKVKDTKTNRFKSISILSEVSTKRIISLTGTLTGRFLYDAYGPLYVTDKDYLKRINLESFWKFLQTHYIKCGFEWRLKSKAFEKITDILKEKVITIKRKDVMEQLPEEIYQTHYWNMSSKLTRAYIDTAKIKEPLLRASRKHQLVSGFHYEKDESGEVKPVYIDNSKQIALIQLLQEMPGAGPFVIWTKFKASRQSLISELEKNSYKIYNDHVEFGLSACANSVFVASHAMHSEGIQLQRSCTAIYYDLDCSPVGYRQSLARINRIGQKSNKVLYIYFLALKSNGSKAIDEKILETLGERMDLANTVEKMISDRELLLRSLGKEEVEEL